MIDLAHGSRTDPGRHRSVTRARPAETPHHAPAGAGGGGRDRRGRGRGPPARRHAAEPQPHDHRRHTRPRAPTGSRRSESESARVMQLLRRTTFGYTPAQLESALSDGFRQNRRPPDRDAAGRAARARGGRDARRQVRRSRSCSSGGSTTCSTTPTPFAERMTLFWHGHFTSDYRKAADNTFMYWQNLTWRRMAMTDLRSMLVAGHHRPGDAPLPRPGDVCDRPEPQRELLARADGALHDGRRQLHRGRRAPGRARRWPAGSCPDPTRRPLTAATPAGNLPVYTSQKQRGVQPPARVHRQRHLSRARPAASTRRA